MTTLTASAKGLARQQMVEVITASPQPVSHNFKAPGIQSSASRSDHGRDRLQCSCEWRGLFSPGHSFPASLATSRPQLSPPHPEPCPHTLSPNPEPSPRALPPPCPSQPAKMLDRSHHQFSWGYRRAVEPLPLYKVTRNRKFIIHGAVYLP